jgi:hypothetical protein
MKNPWFVAGVIALAGITTQAAGAKLPADERPLHIERASKAMVRATLEGPRFYAPELFTAIEDCHNPRLNLADVDGPIVSAFVEFEPRPK